MWSPFRCAKRVIGIAPRMIQLLNPNWWSSFSWKGEGVKARELTHFAIDRGFYDPAKLPQGVEDIPKEKLHRVLSRVTIFAEQMGITQGIQVYSGEI